CPAPVHRQDYHKFFGAPVLFDQPVTRLVFSSSYLSLPLIRSDVALENFLREAPANILSRYRHDIELSARVRSQLNALPMADWPSLEELA
ncbi:AraC family transcriptional regulator, partial [Bacillus safensis]|nr:AraC family transcriptional regulator [Bacillus safensis]